MFIFYGKSALYELISSRLINKSLCVAAVVCATFSFVVSCSSKKNTQTTRAYHAINTKYNIYFNAEQAYNEALKTKLETNKDNFSTILSVYPYNPDLDENKQEGGSFNTTIDKCTKAIKLHSIQTKPERDPDKRRDQKYKEWLKQREFNPFLKNAWLLMGKAEYQNEDYLKSATTFSYITHLYQTDVEIFSEARLWTALAYTQMGWLYEAENIFQKIQTAGIPESLKGDYAAIYSNYLVRNKDYKNAVPYIERAINAEGNHYQKLRLRYLLGQVYTKIGEQEKAYKAFESVQGMRTPYELTLNAKIRQSELYNPKNKKKVISSLNKMAKSTKNTEYLDQIYYALGNIYLNDKDTAQAIQNYEKGIAKSTRNGFDKAICQLRLGGIFFEQRNYIKAQPCYSGVISTLSKKHEAYPLAALRSEVLDELVVHAEAIQLQDSLQYLAKLPEEEKLKAIDEHIAYVKKQEEERQREELLAQQKADEISQRPQTPTAMAMKNTSFYFYNPQTVEQGKQTFKRTWGNRTLEDDWRRQDKKTSLFDSFDMVENGSDSIPQMFGEDGKPLVDTVRAQSDDIYSREFYLQQLPVTEEDFAVSDAIIENAIFNMGNIYKDKLEDSSLAIDAFNTDLKRFPETPNKEEIFYQLFLIYLQLKDKEMAEVYRQKLLSEFSENKYAAMLLDSNYEWNMLNMTVVQDSLYDQTYSAYLNSKIRTVRKNYSLVKEKYPLSKLIPKFMLLNALTYAQTNEADSLKNYLQELVEKYPESDVNAYASGILKNLASGRSLAADNSPTKGMIWDLKFVGEETGENLTQIQFVDNLKTEYTLLLIYSDNIDPNQLIYDVASYNFSQYRRRTFDLSFSQAGLIRMLQVKNFNSLKDINDYLEKAFESNSLLSMIDKSVIPVPISVDNLSSLLKGKSLSEYFTFFNDTHKTDMGYLVAYWDKQIKTEIEKTEEDLQKTETVVVKDVQDSIPEPVIKEPVIVEKPIETPETKTSQDKNKKDEKNDDEISVADMFTDDQVEKIDNIINTATEIINNPVDGIKNLFNKQKDKPKLTKEEKEELKKEKAEQDRLEKERKQAERAVKDSIQRVEKARSDSIENVEKQALELKKQEEKKQQEKEKSLIEEQKAKEKAEKEAKAAAQKQRQEERKAKEKERREKLKQKEKERKEKLKERERERKEREKERSKQRK